MTDAQALAILRDRRGVMYDPAVVDAFVADYINNELIKKNRQVTLTKLRTTSAHDRAAVDAFTKVFNETYDIMSSSCATAAREALYAAGFEPSLLQAILAYMGGRAPLDNNPLPASVGTLAGEQTGAITQTYERGQALPPGTVSSFEKR